MLLRSFILSLSLIWSGSLWTMACYYTLAKDNCWTKYQVTVDVIDAATAKTLLTVTVPSGQSWARQAFSCHQAQKFMYHAHFTPPIWESEKGKIYSARHYWSLPDKVNPGDKAWTVSVCYPADFSEIPFPPEATGNCKCDFSSIPDVTL